MGAAGAGCESCSRAAAARPEQAKEPESLQATQSSSNVRFGGFAMGDLEGGNRGSIEDHYDVEQEEPLGEGQFSIVYRCVQKDTRESFAVKTIVRQWLRSSVQTEMEARLMRAVDHPNIVRLVETFADEKNVYHIMELCKGGELLDFVIDRAPLTERLAGVLFKQMVNPVAYLHNNDIMHRDLKAENWLFADDGRPEKAALKLADFGSAKRLGKEDRAYTKIGTPYYVAPEVVQGSYNHKADVWSLGIILHMLLGGAPPFAGGNTEEVLTEVRTKKVNIDRFGTFISEEAKRLLGRLLERVPEKRLSAADVRPDPWFVKSLGATRARSKGDDEKESQPIASLNQLRGHGQRNKFEKATVAMIASQLGREAIADLEKSFMAMDANGDGTLSLPELTQALQQAGVKLSRKELQRLLSQVDSNNTGSVEYSEFVAIMMDQAVLAREEVCRKAFGAFDLDGSGFIERAELAKLLRSKDAKQSLGRTMASDQEIANICADLDKDGDGRIDFQEFMAMVNRPQQPAEEFVRGNS